jgi:amidophosphoribosyltransferase
MIRHNCGWCATHTLHDAYSFIRSLQHRGREATGIAAISNSRIDVVKWVGDVRKFDVDDLHEIFPGHNYNTFLGHVRYATRGRKDRILEDAHPHVIGGRVERRGDHVFVLDCDAAIVINGQTDDSYFEGMNLDPIVSDCDSEKLLWYYRENGINNLLKMIPGAYTGAIADKKLRGTIVFRDRTGIKPGALGWKDGKFVAASEDMAFRENGGEFTEDLELGAAYFLSHDGEYRKESIVEPVAAHCMFEWQYLAKRNTLMDKISVRNHRAYLGEILAEEFVPEGVDFVTFVPRCPGTAAASYSRKSGIPFRKIFYKMRGERSFQGSTLDERANSINSNLHLSPHVGDTLKDKNVLIVEDSVVRGNVLKRVRNLMYEEAGVNSAIVVSYTPPIGIIGEDGSPRGCSFGVDMPPEDENFVARGRSFDEIGREVEMPIHYMSMNGLFKAFKLSGMPRDRLCSYCIGGEHPYDRITNLTVERT